MVRTVLVDNGKGPVLRVHGAWRTGGGGKPVRAGA